jgi:hypothetical protein
MHRLTALHAVGKVIVATVFLQDDFEANGALKLGCQRLLRSRRTIESRSGMRDSSSGGG